MKQQVKKICMAAVFGLVLSVANAQSDHSVTAPWASDKGYWVTESNIHVPLNYIIRFYNNENVLIYTENLKNVKLNIDKRRAKMKLKKALETAVKLYGQHEDLAVIRDHIEKILKQRG